MPNSEPSPNRPSIVSGNQCRLAIASVNPLAASSRTMCSITGRLRTGTIGFGTAWVIGLNRVPSPAARIIAFMGRSVAVVIGLVRALDRDAEIGGLVLGQLGEADAERLEVEARDLLVEVL